MKLVLAILATLLLATGAQAAYFNHMEVDTGTVVVTSMPAVSVAPSTYTDSVTARLSDTHVVVTSMPEISVAPSTYTDSVTARIDGQVSCTGGVYVLNPQTSVTATLTETNVNVGNWPETQPVSGQVEITGSVPVTGAFFPAVQACTIPAATSTASCTSAGGLTAVVLDLGDTADWWVYVTCPDSCVVGFDATTNIGNGDQVDRVMIYRYRCRYVWVCSEAAYVNPKCIRVRGMK